MVVHPKRKSLYIINLDAPVDGKCRVKIGRTGNIFQRLRHIRTTCPNAYVVAEWKGVGLWVERAAHEWAMHDYSKPVHCGGEVWEFGQHAIFVASGLEEALRPFGVQRTDKGRRETNDDTAGVSSCKA